MITQKSKLKSFAAFNWIGNRWPSDNKSVILDTWQVLELLELSNKGLFMLLCDFGSKLEKYYKDRISGLKAPFFACSYIPM